MRYLLLTLSFIVTSHAQVSQVTFKVLPNKQLEITYSLTEAGDITARAILDHKIIPIKTATGAIGKNISPGPKSLRWDVLKDVERLTGDLEIEVAHRPSYIKVTKDRYKTVQIGKQIWMAENLNIEIDGSSCYNNQLYNCEKYGRLYSWEAAKKIAEQIEGWHLPTNDEWDELYKTLGAKGNIHLDSKNIGYELKVGSPSGFDALLGGYWNVGGSFEFLNIYAYFWSASAYASGQALYRRLSEWTWRVKPHKGVHLYRFSVRLIKD